MNPKSVDGEKSPQALSAYKKGLEAMESKNYPYAVESFNMALQSFPDYVAARYGARAAKGKILGVGKGGGVGRYLGSMGIMAKVGPLKAMGKWEKIIEIVEEKLAIEPKNVTCLSFLGEASNNLGLIATAVRSYRDALEVDPENVKVMKSLAGIYMEMHNGDAAVGLYKKLAEKLPDDFEVQFAYKNAQAMVAIRVSGIDRDLTTKDLDAIRKDKESDEESKRILTKREAVEKEIESVQSAIDGDPLNVDLHTKLAGLYLDINMVQDAISAYESVTVLDPKNIKCYMALADIYSRDEKTIDKAIENYKAIVSIDPGNEEAKVRGRKLELFRLQKVITLYKGMLEKMPSSPEIEVRLEDAKSRETDLLIEEYLDRVTKNPRDVGARFMLGKAYREKGETDKAISEFQVTQNESIRAVASLSMLGLCFMDKNMNDLAAKQFERALSKCTGMTSETKEVIYNLGLVLERMGEIEKAINEYKKIYEVDITFKDVSAKIESHYTPSR